MKYLKFLSYFLIFFLSITISKGQSEELFDNEFVHEIRISINDINFWETLINNYNQNYPDIPYIMADATIDGNNIDSIGIRLKGFSSFWGATDKKSIKLDFNEFVPGKQYKGLKKINLNNGEGDPSLQRDFICYDIFRKAGVGAPRTSYAKVYLNEEYWGLYLIVEQVDKPFLKDNFTNSKGNLFKNMGNSNLEWLGSDTMSYQEIFDLKTDSNNEAWGNFVELMDVINNAPTNEFKDAITNIFNVNDYLKVLAIDVATNNWDSYIEHGRNFYMYQDNSNKKFNWIPWDYNFSLGGTFSFGSIGGPDIGLDSIEITIENPEECTTVMNGSSPYPVTDSIFILVINADAFCCEVDWDSTCQSIYDTLSEGGTDQDTMDDNTFPGELLPVSQAFPVDMSSSQKVLINRLLSVPEFRDQYYKGWCKLLEDNFTPERILPIIDHNTDLIRDDVYADPNYLWTTNQFEADLLEGAAPVVGIKKYFREMPQILKGDLDSNFDCSALASVLDFNDVVINEFAASSDSLSGIADSSGKFEDWIELYNNTDEDIDLSNAFLTDKIDQPEKWAFPNGTIISAGGYLTLWADEDQEEEGLHTNFKLSKSGEFIMLTDGSTVLDSITFNEQITNMTMSRIPNGTGDFVIQDPTFGFNNEESTSTSDFELLNEQLTVYPNPVSDILSIELKDSNSVNSRLTISNNIGQNIFAKRINTISTTIDVSSFESGIYHVQLKDEDGKIIGLKNFIVI